jgi:hypothetical protein
MKVSEEYFFGLPRKGAKNILREGGGEGSQNNTYVEPQVANELGQRSIDLPVHVYRSTKLF